MLRPRALSVAVAITLVFALGCQRGGSPDAPLRLGYFPNVTHAQALVGVDDGTFARSLSGRLETRMFNAGPPAMEALLAGDLDASYVGPGPVAIAFLRTHAQALRVVAGAVSGGAALVVKDARAPADLAGKRVASPQLGNTRTSRCACGCARPASTTRAARFGGGDALANPDILPLFARGDLAGAWVPEPWAARLVAEAGGRILVDERTLWPEGRFPTTVLVVSTRALERRRADVLALVRAHLELTRRWQQDPDGFARLVNAAYGKRTGKPLPDAVLRDAFSRITPVIDPLTRQLEHMARDAQALRFAPEGDLSGMVDATMLEELAQR
jgi:NitT/TauT family transport system substrate-binding protein